MRWNNIKNQYLFVFMYKIFYYKHVGYLLNKIKLKQLITRHGIWVQVPN